MLPADLVGASGTPALGQHGQGFGELYVLHLHHEAEDVSADIAHPTFERLPFRVHL